MKNTVNFGRGYGVRNSVTVCLILNTPSILETVSQILKPSVWEMFQEGPAVLNSLLVSKIEDTMPLTAHCLPSLCDSCAAALTSMPR